MSMNKAQASKKGWSAVVVNDSPVQLTMLGAILRKDGWHVSELSKVEDALEHMTRNGPPSLVVTDLQMPGIDGWRFCRLLRSPECSPFNDVPILVVSATFGGEEVGRLTTESGADAFLEQPIDARRLLDVAGSLVRGGKHEMAPRILVAESDPDLGRKVAKAFVKHACKVDTAATASDALRLFVAAAYDAAVIDSSLPGATGEDLLEEFQRQRPACACIMVSDQLGPELVKNWMRKGAAGYVRKPFDPDHVVELCATARRERALLRIGALLERRTLELRESDERHRAILDQLPEAAHIVDRDLRVVLWNKRLGQLCDDLGFDPGEPGRALNDVFPFLSRDVLDQYRQVFRTGEALVTEEDTLVAGQTRTTETRKVPWIREGRAEKVYTILTDVTELRRSRDLLQDQYDLATFLAQSSSLNKALRRCVTAAMRAAGADCGGVHLVDENSGVLHLAWHTGLPPAFAKRISSFQPATPVAELVRVGKPIYQPGAFPGFERGEASGPQDPFALALIPVRNHGRLVGCLILASHTVESVPEFARKSLEAMAGLMGQAISEMRTRERLKDERENLNAFFNTVSDFLFVVDTRGVVLHVNNAVCEVLGYQQAEVAGRPIADLHPEDLRQEAARTLQAVVRGSLSVCSLPLQARDGRRIPVHTRVTQGRWNGRPGVLFGVSRDMTKEQEYQAAIRRRSELSRALSEVSHRCSVAGPDECDAAVDNALACFGPLLTAGRAGVFQFLNGANSADNTHEWCGGGVTPRRDRLQGVDLERALPWFMARIGRADVLAIPDVSDLPAEAAADRSHWESGGVCSLIAVPLRSGSATVGFIGFGVTGVPRAWSSDEASALQSLAAVLQSLLERRRMELALRVSEKRYRLLFESMDCGFALHEVVCDENGRVCDYRFLEVNPAFERMTGLPAKDVVGRTAREILPNLEDLWLERYAEVAQTGTPVHFEQRSEALGRAYEVSAYSPDKGLFATVFEDVTERREREEELRLYKRILDNSGEAVSVTDEQGRYVYVNPAHERLLGRSLEECRSTSFRGFYEGRSLEVVQREVWPSLVDGKGWEGELNPTDASGRKFPMRVRADSIHGEDGAMHYAFGLMHDLTDEKHEEARRMDLERRLQQVDKDESLERMAGAVAHHYNNILGGILGSLELALDSALTGEVRECLEGGLDAAHRGAHLGRRMLTYLGQGHFASKPVRCDLSEEVRAALESFSPRRSPTVSLREELAPGLPPLVLHSGPFREALYDLLENAFEALERPGGILRVSTGVMYANEAYVSKCLGHKPLWPGQYLYVEIEDNGPGLSSESVQRVFDPFFSTKFAGRGLGLATVLGTVRSQRGGILFRSDRGKGTLVRLLLPPYGKPPAHHSSSAGRAAERSRVVLVVDDEPALRELAAAHLRREGHVPLTAASGEEAIQTFQSKPDEIDCVVTDLTMEGMNGWQLTRRLRALRQALPVIVITGHEPADVAGRSKAEERLQVLHKPFRPQELAKAVNEALGVE